MVGLGETKEEMIQVMDDLRSAEVDFITIGQYLQPSAKHHPLDGIIIRMNLKNLRICKNKRLLTCFFVTVD